MKKVAFYLGWPSGGVETFVSHLVDYLPTLGWQPYVLVNMAVCSNWSVYYRERKATVVELPFESFEDPKGRRYILASLLRYGIDVYVPNYQEIPHLVTKDLDGTQIASILIANASFEEYLAEITPYAKYAKRFIGVSKNICDLLGKIKHVPSERIVYIPPGVHLAPEFSEKNPNLPIRIIYTGRITDENKRVWRYIDLAKHLLRLGIEFELTLLGDGPERNAIKEVVLNNPELGRRVHLPGSVQPSEVPNHLLGHDVFILLSDTEGFSLSLLEAMGHGLVPVTSHIKSGISEVIRSGENGIVVPIGDTQAAAYAIKVLLDDPKTFKAMAKKAYNTVVPRYSIRRMAKTYAKLFDEIRV